MMSDSPVIIIIFITIFFADGLLMFWSARNGLFDEDDNCDADGDDSDDDDDDDDDEGADHNGYGEEERDDEGDILTRSHGNETFHQVRALKTS